MIEKQLRALVKNRDRRIAELEAEVDGKDLLIEDLNHQIDGFKELEAEVKALRDSLNSIAQWCDTPKDGSYSHFDEPCSAQEARDALDRIKGVSDD